MTLVVLPFACIGQYNYFDIDITSQSSDGHVQVTNVEPVGENYFLWGSRREGTQIFPFVEKYSAEGDFEESFEFAASDSIFYVGSTDSFRFVDELAGFVAFNSVDPGSGPSKGYRVFVDLDLTSVEKLFYDVQDDLYPESFIGFREFYGDHIAIGSKLNTGNAFVSYYSRISISGEVIWTYEIDPPNDQTYRVEDFVLFEDKILFTGFRRDGFTFHASYTLVDTTGSVIDEPFLTNSMGGNQALVTKSESDGILFAYTQNYEWNEDIGDPYIYWTELALSYYDTITNTVSEPIEHLNNYEYMVMKIRDVIPASDNGFVILGTSLNESFEFLSWVAKVNSNLELDWFQEYSYESCSSCDTGARDIDVAPDGGYVFTGYWQDFIQGGFQQAESFLVKLDACGDFEWEGCEPVSVGLEEQSKLDFNVYPNPAEDELTIQLEDQNEAETWRVLDLQGRTVQEGVIYGFTTRVSLNLPSGLYVLMIESEAGKLGVKKVQVL